MLMLIILRRVVLFQAVDGSAGENGAESSKAAMTTTGMVFGMFGNMTMGVVNQVSQEKVGLCWMIEVFASFETISVWSINKKDHGLKH